MKKTDGITGRDTRAQFEAEAWERARGWTRGLPNADERNGGDVTDDLVRELQAAGVPLVDLGELANVHLTYPASIPILLKHLYAPYPQGVISTIVQVLGSRLAGQTVNRALVEFLRSRWAELSDDTLFRLGDAIAITSRKPFIGDLFEVASTPHYRTARMSPMLKIAKMQDARVPSIVESYLNEENINPWLAMRVLRLAKLWNHAGWVAPYLTSSNEYHRTEAREFFRALEKANIK